MISVIEQGGFQFKVSEGDTIRVPSIDAEKGSEILLEKVKLYGADKNMVKFLTSYLRNRNQIVILDDQWSSKRRLPSKGVPQGSILGPLLFLIYINDLPDVVDNLSKLFADDAKLLGKTKNYDQIDSMRQDLQKLFEWSNKWGMAFNAEKCKVMHIGRGNFQANYEINDQQLSDVKEEKDLGIIVSSDLKVSPQCVKAVKNANKVLGCIKRTIEIRDKNIIMDLYKALVRPHLEFCMSAWRPHYVKDIQLLEGVQRRATKLISELRGLNYNERLKKVNLTTLETRRLRGDMIEVFKIFNGLTDLKASDFFTPSNNELRGHCFKLFKPRVYSDIGKFSFVYRVVDRWNSLPADVVTAGSLNLFKNKLDLCIRNVWGLT